MAFAKVLIVGQHPHTGVTAKIEIDDEGFIVGTIEHFGTKMYRLYLNDGEGCFAEKSNIQLEKGRAWVLK